MWWSFWISCQLLLQSYLFLIKDPMWNSLEEVPKWDYCSFLSFVLLLFRCAWLQLLGSWSWTVGVFCLVFSIWVSFNLQNERGVVNKSLFPVHLQDLLVSVGVRLYAEQICPVRESVSSCNYRFSWCMYWNNIRVTPELPFLMYFTFPA